MNSYWTKNELQAYILLYAAQANFIETEEEKRFILSKVDDEVFEKIKLEIKHDNDYQCIEKIQSNLKFHQYTQDDIENLLNDIKSVFYSDGTFDSIEKNMMMYLKKILK